jgi:chaperone required for assembly of F1-ATPase
MFLSSENNDVIQDNNVTTDFNCTIKLYGVRKTNVTNNYLISQELIGDASVDDYNGNDNVIQLNQPAEPVKEYSLKVDTTEFTQGTNATITATIYYGDDVATDISNGKVTFKVNGKTLKDANGKVIYAKVVNGVATIENYVVPDDWSKDGTTIQAIYSGSTDCEKLTSEKTNITIIADEPTITTSDITATAGETITLTATITDNNKVINNGKIVFKINGKTVKDANGKVIYAKVVNNQVSVEYTLPADMKAKDYNITATFISSDYERIEDTKTLTITA